MQNDVLVRIGELDDHDLLVRLKRCVAEDRAVTACLLEHFAEVDARGLYRDQGFSSMFEYAVHGLYMSESEGGLRITVGRLVRQFPQALEMLGRGEIHLTALRLLAPRLTAKNLELLQQARFKSKREVQELIARHFPQPDVSDSIRRLPVPRSAAFTVAQPGLLFCASPRSERATAATSVAAQQRYDEPLSAAPSVTAQQRYDEPLSVAPGVVGLELNHGCCGSHAVPGLAASSSVAPAAQQGAARGGGFGRRASASAVSVPLSEGRFKVQFTAGQGLHDKLKQAQELMRHCAPSGDLAIVLERAVDLLIAERKKQLFGQVARPRRRNSGNSVRRSRYVPRVVRREVVERAEERCTFVSPDGRRCSARGRLELDHRVPHGRGGAATADNLRVLCRSHNLLMAERVYGLAFMRRRIESAQQTRAGTPAIDHDQRTRSRVPAVRVAVPLKRPQSTPALAAPQPRAARAPSVHKTRAHLHVPDRAP